MKNYTVHWENAAREKARARLKDPTITIVVTED